MNPMIIAALVIAAVSGTTGWKVSSWYYLSKINSMQIKQHVSAEEARKRVKTIELLNAEITTVIEERDLAMQQEERVVERIVTNEVIKYVQNTVIEHCDVPVEFVRLHDAAASGGVPDNAESADAADDASRGTSDADVLQVVTTNYSTCRRTRNQLINLQAWIEGVMLK